MGKILKIREVGDPVLNLVCQKVDVQNINNETLEDIEDLKETLKFTGGFGIAGPQVGINNGEKIVKKVSGFTARDIQHECDHLDGIIFLERVTQENGFATKEMINKYNLRNS